MMLLSSFQCTHLSSKQLAAGNNLSLGRTTCKMCATLSVAPEHSTNHNRKLGTARHTMQLLSSSMAQFAYYTPPPPTLPWQGI
jgi:hypothetical protein